MTAGLSNADQETGGAMSDADRIAMHRLHSLDGDFRACATCRHAELAVNRLIARERKSARDQALDEAAGAIEAGVLPHHPSAHYRDGFARSSQIVRALKST